MILESIYSDTMVVEQSFKNILPQVICIKLHVHNFEILCYHFVTTQSNLNITNLKLKVNISSFQKGLVFENQSIKKKKKKKKKFKCKLEYLGNRCTEFQYENIFRNFDCLLFNQHTTKSLYNTANYFEFLHVHIFFFFFANERI